MVRPDFEEPKWFATHIRKLRVAAKKWGLYDQPIAPTVAESCLERAAGEAIVEAAETHVREYGAKVTILALAPLTNVAYAVEHFRERLVKSVSHIVFAGDWVSKVTSEGKVAHPVNVRADESSFWKVLESTIPVYLCRPTNIDHSWDPLAQDMNTVVESTVGAKVIRFLACAADNASELGHTHEAICSEEGTCFEPMPKFGTERIHLKQDPIAAFNLVQPECFLQGDNTDLPEHLRSSVHRLVQVDCEKYTAWLRQNFCLKQEEPEYKVQAQAHQSFSSKTEK